MGLITPCRSKQILTNKFSTPYAISENPDEVVVANPTNKTITIKKNCQIAEFHPRNSDAFTILQCGEKMEKEAQQELSGGKETVVSRGMPGYIEGEGGASIFMAKALFSDCTPTKGCLGGGVRRCTTAEHVGNFNNNNYNKQNNGSSSRSSRSYSVISLIITTKTITITKHHVQTVR